MAHVSETWALTFSDLHRASAATQRLSYDPLYGQDRPIFHISCKMISPTLVKSNAIRENICK